MVEVIGWRQELLISVWCAADDALRTKNGPGSKFDRKKC